MRHVGAVIVLSTITALGLSFVHPFGDPRKEQPKGVETLLRDTSMPAPARAVLLNKCADCHSSETRWPLYARVAPGSWLIERDIIEARKKMDFSRWNEMSADRQQVMEAKILQEARSGDMPPLQYRVVHWRAALSKSDLQVLAALGKEEGGAEASATGLGDAVRGKAVFDRRCTGCHAMNADREGPRLTGAFGRKAGTSPGFDYSAGLQNLKVTWDEATLEKWLSDPDLMVPDNRMSFRIAKVGERQDLIAYLKQSR